MLVFQGFENKKEAKACMKRTRGSYLAYQRDGFGRSKNKDHYRVAVTVGRLDENKYPYCVFYEE